MRIMGLEINRRPKEKKESRSWPAILALVAGNQYVWTPANYEALAKAGYQSVVDCYQCIDLIAKSVGTIPWILQRVDKNGDPTEIKAHPLLKLMDKPNPRDGGAKFREATIKYLLISGNSYIEQAGPTSGPNSGQPLELYNLRPDRMAPIPGDTIHLVRGYKYIVAGRETDFTTDQVLQIAEFHPTHDWYGLSRLEVASRIIDISNLGNEWNANLLHNDARPSGVIKATGRLTEDQRNAIRQQFSDKYAGSENAGKTLVLEGVEDWKQAGLSPIDMDWLEGDKNVTRKICRIFGVAPELIGDASNKTYSNYKEARLAFYMETVLPMARMLRDELNNWLTPKFCADRMNPDLRLDIDEDQIPAIQEKREEAYNRILPAYWLTFNEKREAVGYDAVDGPLGDMFHLPMGLTSTSAEEEKNPTPAPATSKTPEQIAAYATNPGATPGNPPPKPAPKPAPGPMMPAPAKGKASSEIKHFWKSPERKELLWKAYALRVEAKSKGFDKAIQKYLVEQGKEIAARVARLQSFGPGTAEALVGRQAAKKDYIKRFKPRYHALYATARVAGEHAVQGKIYTLDEDTKTEFKMSAEQEAKIDRLIEEAGDYITDTTIEDIKDLLYTAVDETWTTSQLAKEVGDKIETGSWQRARLIAVTETAILENSGTLDGYKENEFVERKGWLCSFVPDSREGHKEANEQEVGIDDPFEVANEKGGVDQFDYPGDRSHNPDPSNSINCLCYLYPIVPELE